MTDVTNVARSHNKIESLIKVTFGEADDMDRPLAAVTQGMKTGCWVILENCHLAARWTEEFLHQLEVELGPKRVPYFFLGSLLGTRWSAIGQFFLSLITVPEIFLRKLTRFSRSFLLGFKVANDVKN